MKVNLQIIKNNTMKKLLFLFMLPALGFSQTFEEIITMTDVERFRKVMIENDYKRHTPQKSSCSI